MELIRDVLEEAAPAAVRWLLDRPVSNSGRLAALIRGAAGDRDWAAECVRDPDPLLYVPDDGADPDFVAATADAGILDRCGAWCDLAGAAVAGVAGAKVLDLSEVTG